jgi:DNA-binding transcriptional LysR family regulator
LLVRLDEERNLARAAAAAGLTQPAASKLLRQIESDFEVKLFDRLARGMAPTCYGEILIRHARLALSEFGLARDEIVALKSGLSGKAAIGTVLNPGTNLVPMAVVRMKQRYPGVLTSIEIGSSRTLVQKLVRGELDMVVGRVLDSTSADELVYEPLAPDEPHAVIASVEHPLACRQELQLEQLIEQPWILPPAGSLVRDRLAAMLVRHGLPLPGNIVESQCLPVITALLQQSNMLAILPEEAVQSCCKAGILTVLVRNLPLEVGAFGLITRRNHKLSPGAQLMLSALREQGGQMYPVDSHRPACTRLAVV